MANLDRTLTENTPDFIGEIAENILVANVLHQKMQQVINHLCHIRLTLSFRLRNTGRKHFAQIVGQYLGEEMVGLLC